MSEHRETRPLLNASPLFVSYPGKLTKTCDILSEEMGEVVCCARPGGADCCSCMYPLLYRDMAMKIVDRMTLK